MPKGSFHKPSFLECVKEEYQACREGVGVIDLSSFTKIEVTVKYQFRHYFCIFCVNVHLHRLKIYSNLKEDFITYDSDAESFTI